MLFRNQVPINLHEQLSLADDGAERIVPSVQ